MNKYNMIHLHGSRNGKYYKISYIVMNNGVEDKVLLESSKN